MPYNMDTRKMGLISLPFELTSKEISSLDTVKTRIRNRAEDAL